MTGTPTERHYCALVECDELVPHVPGEPPYSYRRRTTCSEEHRRIHTGRARTAKMAPWRLVERACALTACTVKFYPATECQKFCSFQCGVAARTEGREPESKLCALEGCGQVLTRPLRISTKKWERTRFCSHECHRRWRTGRPAPAPADVPAEPAPTPPATPTPTATPAGRAPFRPGAVPLEIKRSVRATPRPSLRAIRRPDDLSERS